MDVVHGDDYDAATAEATNLMDKAVPKETEEEMHSFFSSIAETSPSREHILHEGSPWGALDLGPGVGNVTVCSFICFDREHPESARSCGKLGAEIVLHPTACVVDRAMLDKLAVRAARNGMAIVMTNFANTSATRDPAEVFMGQMNGHSAAVDARGRFITVAPGPVEDPSVISGPEGVYLADVDLAAQRAYRRTRRAHALMGGAPLMPGLCRLVVAREFSQPQCNAHRLWL